MSESAKRIERTNTSLLGLGTDSTICRSGSIESCAEEDPCPAGYFQCCSAHNNHPHCFEQLPLRPSVTNTRTMRTGATGFHRLARHDSRRRSRVACCRPRHDGVLIVICPNRTKRCPSRVSLGFRCNEATISVAVPPTSNNWKADMNVAQLVQYVGLF
jgi:hypothetical protein